MAASVNTRWPFFSAPTFSFPGNSARFADSVHLAKREILGRQAARPLVSCCLDGSRRGLMNPDSKKWMAGRLVLGLVLVAAGCSGRDAESRTPEPGDAAAAAGVPGCLPAASVPTRGCAAGLLGAYPEDPSAIAVDEHYIYANARSIWRMPKAGGPFEHLLESAGGPELAVDATHVYFGEGEPSPTSLSYRRLRRAPKCGGRITTLTESTASELLALTIDATHVYYVHGTTIMRIQKEGGQAEALAVVGTERPAHLLCDGDFLYWTWGNEIRRVAVTGAPVETVLRTQQAIGRLTMDAESYYFASVRSMGPNQVVRARRDGGGIQELGAFQGGQLHKLGRYLYVVGGDVFQLDTEREPAWVVSGSGGHYDDDDYAAVVAHDTAAIYWHPRARARDLLLR
jgi:hypothetical protein